MKNIKKKIYYVRNIIISICLFPFFSKKAKNKKIIIFGFGNNFYENSIRFVYEYYLKQYSEKYSIFAVFDKNSIGCKAISTNNILYRGTIRTYLYFLYSTAIVFDMSDSDVAPGLQKHVKRVKKIFITHGMEGLKNVDYIFRDRRVVADVMFAASDFEKSIKNKFGKYPNIYVTGYPRFDFYKKESEKKQILIMLTWRNWLNSNTIRQSKYLEKLIELLENKEFNTFLLENDIICHLKIHAQVKKILKEFSIDNSNVVMNSDIDFRTIISESSVLITDYSSISWDFIYYDRPVIFYQFDKQEYESRTGKLYLDVKSDELGDFAITSEDVVSSLKRLFYEDKFKHRQITNKDKFFKYIDNNNLQRCIDVMESIINT